MIFNSKSKINIVGELSQKILFNCPEVYVGELLGHFDMGHFSQSRERALYHFNLIFSHDSR